MDCTAISRTCRTSNLLIDNRICCESEDRISEQPSQDARGRPYTAVCCYSSAGHCNDECFQIPPLNTRSFKAGVFVTASICSNVIIWDVFEIKDGLFSKAMLAFHNDCPEDLP